MLVESKHVTLLTDPVVGYVQSETLPRISVADLPERIDYVMLTHAHADHLMLETMLELRSRIGTVLVPKSNGGSLQDPSLKLLLQHLGFKHVESGPLVRSSFHARDQVPGAELKALRRRQATIDAQGRVVPLAG